jgi:hypothetical protein
MQGLDGLRPGTKGASIGRDRSGSQSDKGPSRTHPADADGKVCRTRAASPAVASCTAPPRVAGPPAHRTQEAGGLIVRGHSLLMLLPKLRNEALTICPDHASPTDRTPHRIRCPLQPGTATRGETVTRRGLAQPKRQFRAVHRGGGIIALEEEAALRHQRPAGLTKAIRLQRVTRHWRRAKSQTQGERFQSKPIRRPAVCQISHRRGKADITPGHHRATVRPRAKVTLTRAFNCR